MSSHMGRLVSSSTYPQKYHVLAESAYGSLYGAKQMQMGHMMIGHVTGPLACGCTLPHLLPEFVQYMF